MRYEFKLNFDEYLSFLKMNARLRKGKDKIDKILIIVLILIYICISISLRLIGLKILSNIFVVLVGGVSVFLYMILSNRVLSTNPKIIAKIMAKKKPEIIFSNRALEIKDDEFILYEELSSRATNGKAIKDVIIYENIIGIVSIKDELCAYIPTRVFRDEKEKEEFIKVVRDIRENNHMFDEKMDYSYKIDVNDYANYMMAYNRVLKIQDKINIFSIVLMGILGAYSVLKYIKYGNYKMAIMIIFVYIIFLVIFIVFMNDNRLIKKIALISSERYLKKNPNFLNEQQIKLEDYGVLYHMNNTTIKINFNDIKNVILKNNTIVVLGKMNMLLFIIPTNVFNKEDERDSFIDFLKKNS